jgi:hypothetical protein
MRKLLILALMGFCSINSFANEDTFNFEIRSYDSLYASDSPTIEDLLVHTYNTDGSMNPHLQNLDCKSNKDNDKADYMTYKSTNELLNLKFEFTSHDSCLEVATCLTVLKSLGSNEQSVEPESEAVHISVNRETKVISNIDLPEVCSMRDLWANVQ